jgi:hypothetical protein
MAFADSDNKKVIRDGWDLPILDRWSGVIGRKLTYFGLPGPRMLDLRAWASILERRRDAVEERPNLKAKRALADEAAAELQRNALRYGLADGLEILRGDVGEIIMDGVDKLGVQPQLSDAQPAERARFAYDLHNLDFDGGLGFIVRRTGEAPRVDAIKKLIERQKGHSFVLMLTVNVRNTLGPNIEDFLDRLNRLPAGDLIGWYQSRGAGEVEHRLKAVVPIIVRGAGEAAGFVVSCYPPVAYTGHESARMVHFCFELTTEDRVFAGVSHQQDADLLQLPLLEAVDGLIRFAPLQHDACDRDSAVAAISFLKPELASGDLAERLRALAH